jgi:MFS family permease
MQQTSTVQQKFKVGGGGAIAVLIVLTLLYMINMADRALLSVALQPIKLAFNLTDTQAGALPSLLTIGIAVLTIPAAILADRWLRRKVVALMGLVWSLATLATGFAANYAHIGIARFFVGGGEAGYAPAGTSWLSLSFRKEIRSLIIGIFFLGSQLGSVLGLVVGGLLITMTHDWRTPFYFFAIPGVILAVIAWFLRDYKSVKEEGEATLSKAYFKDWINLFKIKSFWTDTIGQSFFYFASQTLPAWVPTLLIRTFKMTPGAAGGLYGMTVLIVLLAVPLGGWLADVWQRHDKSGRAHFIALTGSLALITTFITLILTNPDLPVWIVVTGLVVTTFFYGLTFPAMLTIRTDITPVRLRSTAYGIGTFIQQITGATFGSLIVGAISDSLGGGWQGLQWGLIYILPLAALGIIAYLILPKFYSSDSAKVSDEVMAEG